MALPTREEINPYDDLDGRVACEHFYGKSLAEAESLFREGDVYYQSDLMWMGMAAFRFYLPAVVQFINRSGREESDFVAHFASTLEFRLKGEAEELKPVATQLVALCDYILEHRPTFAPGAAEYGNVDARYRSLRESFFQLAHDA